MIKAPSRRGRTDGFLLAEMLTTLTISAFVLAGLVGLSSLLLRSVDRSVARIATTDDLDRTLDVLRREIETAARARFVGAEPQPFLFNGDGNRMMFAGPEPGLQGGTRVVALKSDAGRLFQADAALGAGVGSLGDLRFGKPRLIYGGAARIRFAYLGAPSPGVPEKRLASWPMSMAPPAAVVIEALEPATGRVLVTVRATFRVNADVGCLDKGFCGRADGPDKTVDAGSPSSPPAAVGTL